MPYSVKDHEQTSVIDAEIVKIRTAGRCVSSLDKARFEFADKLDENDSVGQEELRPVSAANAQLNPPGPPVSPTGLAGKKKERKSSLLLWILCLLLLGNYMCETTIFESAPSCAGRGGVTVYCAGRVACMVQSTQYYWSKALLFSVYTQQSGEKGRPLPGKEMKVWRAMRKVGRVNRTMRTSSGSFLLFSTFFLLLVTAISAINTTGFNNGTINVSGVYNITTAIHGSAPSCAAKKGVTAYSPGGVSCTALHKQFYCSKAVLFTNYMGFACTQAWSKSSKKLTLCKPAKCA